jgi:hypothetical protein
VDLLVAMNLDIPTKQNCPQRFAGMPVRETDLPTNALHGEEFVGFSRSPRVGQAVV